MCVCRQGDVREKSVGRWKEGGRSRQVYGRGGGSMQVDGRGGGGSRYYRLLYAFSRRQTRSHTRYGNSHSKRPRALYSRPNPGLPTLFPQLETFIALIQDYLYRTKKLINFLIHLGIYLSSFEYIGLTVGLKLIPASERD